MAIRQLVFIGLCLIAVSCETRTPVEDPPTTTTRKETFRAGWILGDLSLKRTIPSTTITTAIHVSIGDLPGARSAMFPAGACYEIRLWCKSEGREYPLSFGVSDEDIFTSHPTWCPNVGTTLEWRPVLYDDVMSASYLSPPHLPLPLTHGPRYVSVRFTAFSHEFPHSDPESLRNKEVAASPWFRVP